MLKLHISIAKRILELKDDEVMKGCDGKTYFTARREGEYIIIAETP